MYFKPALKIVFHRHVRGNSEIQAKPFNRPFPITQPCFKALKRAREYCEHLGTLRQDHPQTLKCPERFGVSCESPKCSVIDPGIYEYPPK